MWIVIKQEFKITGPPVFGSKNSGRLVIVIDRLVDSLDDVEKGEAFFKCNIKK